MSSSRLTFFWCHFIGKEKAHRFNVLKQQLAMTSANVASDSSSMNGATRSLTQRDQIKNEIENILAADCLYCGDYMIDSIDKPFIDDWDKVNLDWQ